MSVEGAPFQTGAENPFETKTDDKFDLFSTEVDPISGRGDGDGTPGGPSTNGGSGETMVGNNGLNLDNIDEGGAIDAETDGTAEVGNDPAGNEPEE